MNGDMPPPSQSRSMPAHQPRRRSRYGEHTTRVQSSGRNPQQEVSKTTYVEGSTVAGRPGIQRFEIRTRSMSLNPNDPTEPTETSCTTTTSRPTSPTRICKSCSLPLEPIQERSNSFAMSMSSAMQHVGQADEDPLVPTSQPVRSKKDKRVLGCIPIGRLSWPPRLFKRKAKTTDSSSNVGENVNGRAMPTKAASEGSVLSLPPITPVSNNKLMSPIQEDVVDSPISYWDRQRVSSPEPLACACKGIANDAGYPDVVCSAYYCVPVLSMRITVDFLTESRDLFLRQISIASCSDEQSTFEGPKGLSVTQVSGMLCSHSRIVVPDVHGPDIDVDKDLGCV